MFWRRATRTRVRLRPTPLGDVIPPEFATETNWAYENYDLHGTRDVKGSSINSSSIGQLGDAWAFPVQSSAAFGALTANPTIVGTTLYIQDASANVYAINLETGEQIWANMYNDVVPSGGPNGVTAAYGLLFTSLGGAGDVLALKAGYGRGGLADQHPRARRTKASQRRRWSTTTW